MAVAIAGGVAGIVAARAPVLALLVLGLAGAAVVGWASVGWPATLASALLFLVVAQDALVAHGLPLAQQADEVLILALVASGAWRAASAVHGSRTPAARDAARTTGHPLLGAPWDGAMVALVAVACLGAAWRGVPPLVAALGVLAIVKGPMAGAAAARAPITARGAQRAADWAAGLVAVAGSVAVAQRLGGATVFEWTGHAAHLAIWQGAKAPGLFAHHNALAHASVLAGAWWLGRRAAGLAPSAGVRAAEVATLAGLVASASREGWVAAVAGLAAVAFAGRRRGARAERGATQEASIDAAAAAGHGGDPAGSPSRPLAGLALALAAVLVAAGMASYAASDVLRAEMARRWAGVPSGWRDVDLGLDDWAFRGEYRVYVLRRSLQIWADHPLLGTGPGRYGGAVAERFGSPVYDAYGFLPLDGRFAPLDLFWARLPAELGALGAAAFVVLLVAGARAAAGARHARQPVVRALGLAAIGSWAAAVVLAGFAPSFEEPLVVVPLWLVTAAAWALHRAEPARGPR